ncbi:DNA primase [Acuticoccus sp.]|uniref:DNA primase n=1 Tax=Acuticoccus sp. TaxID=1904378 RepID=UPI003B51A141
MRFTQDFLTDLRDRVPLSSIVGRVVTFDRRKSQPARGDHWACCPFHQERTPSFHVDDRRGFYHCFGCQQSGDHISFLTDHGGLDFVDAVKALAAEAGVALPEPDAPVPEATRRRDADRAALEAAAAHYEATLWSPSGRAARDYATGRGFGAEVLRAFGFGLAPTAAGSLARVLSAQGFGEANLECAGLAVRRDGRLRERFVGRLMVPIHDARGRLVGFGGRSLDGRDPKYLNSPQGTLFDKSSVLFNAHRARAPARRTGRLFIVEGYLDAVALAAAGVEEVVASCGTALTEAQLALAWQLADEPILTFDGDRAGRDAAKRVIDRALPLLSGGRSVQVLHLPDGQDPDDLVRTDGAAGFEALVKRAVPLVDAVFSRETERGVDTPERHAALVVRLDALAATISDGAVAGLYRTALRDRAFALRRSQRAERSGASPARALAPPSPMTAPAADRALLDLERIVLGLLLLRPELLGRYGERLTAELFSSEANAGFAALLVEAHAAEGPATAAELIKTIPASGGMCLAEVWGDASAAVGPRLLARFSILDCRPDDAFLERCLVLFLDRLTLRTARAELIGEPRRLVDRDADDERLLRLSAALQARAVALQEAERALADEAATLRRRRTSAGTDAVPGQFR